MTLREKQSLFASMIPVLFNAAWELGFEITVGEVWRSPEEARRLKELGLGIVNSLHTKRLAIDINLFKDGKYLKKSEDYESLGIKWESFSTSSYTCAWGGRFKRPDGNHFSIEHNGVR